jgi:hypothetical protein
MQMQHQPASCVSKGDYQAATVNTAVAVLLAALLLAPSELLLDQGISNAS